MNDTYEDIIRLPHHVSQRHPQMSMADRAAQFSPFAALTGHEDAIREAARLTEERPLLDESVKWEISEQLQLCRANPQLSATLTYFVPDSRKKGGHYAESYGKIRTIIPHERLIIMADGTRIPIDDVISVEIMST